MALYLYVLPLGGSASLAIVIVLAILTFVPTPPSLSVAAWTLEPTQHDRRCVWAPLVGWMIWKLPDSSVARE